MKMQQLLSIVLSVLAILMAHGPLVCRNLHFALYVFQKMYAVRQRLKEQLINFCVIWYVCKFCTDNFFQNVWLDF